MEGKALAEAYIRVRADMSSVAGDIQRGTAGAVDKAGAATGRRLKDAVTKPLQAGLAEGAKTAGPAGEAAGGKFREGVASRMKGTAVDAEKSGRESGKRFSEGQTVSVREGGVRFSETIREGFKAGLVGLTAGMAGLGAIEVFKNFLEGAAEARKTAAITEKVIETTGGAAHVTADQVDELAQSISNKTGIDAEQVHSSENLLLTFTNVKNAVGEGNNVFDQATGLIQDMSVALGQDAKSSAIQLGKALQDPVAGATALRRVGVALDDQQKAQIKTFVASGRTLDAQKVILAEVGKEFGGAAEAAATPLGKLQAQATNTGRVLGGYLLPAVDATATGTANLVGFLTRVPAPVYAGVAAFAALRVGMSLAAAAAGRFTAAGGLAGTLGVLRSGVSGLVGLLGGPWGIAFLGAAAAVGFFVKQLQDTHAEEDALRATLDKTTGAITDQTTAWVSNKLQQDGVLSAARQLGVSYGDVTLAALGNADAQTRVNDAVKGYLPIATSHGVAMTDQGRAADKLRGAINGTSGEITGQVEAMKQQKAAEEQAAAATHEATAATDKQSTAAAREARATRAAVAALADWIGKLTRVSDMFLKGRETERAYKDAIDAATAAVKANGRSLDDNTAKGRANEAALDAVTSSGRGYLQYLVDSKAPGSRVRAEWEAQRSKLRDVYLQFDHNKGKALDYINHALGKVPPRVSTRVETPGLTAAQRAFQNLARTLRGMPSETIRMTVNADGTAVRILTAGNHTTSTKYFAEGGVVRGPGGPRGDRIPARLSDGEFVVNAASTARHRPLLEAINARRYADGGVVSRSVRDVVNVHHVPRDIDRVVRAGLDRLVGGYFKGLAGGGGPVPGGSGVTRWGPMVRRALTLLREPQSLWDNWMRQINTESGGNPNAINLTDSNARAGTPSQGLLQTIWPTFAAYHWPGTSWSMRDGWANMIAAMNYGKHRYGSRQEQVIGHGHGYAAGTRSAAPGWAWTGEHGRELINFRGGEQVLSATASRGADAGGPVRLHPDDLAALGRVIAAAVGRQAVVIDGHTLAGYVDRSLGRATLSVRG